MKIKTIVLSLIAALTLAASAFAADETTHNKKTSGPNGGRVLTNSEPRAEFFVTAERKVRITFLGEDGKAMAPVGQVVTVTAGERSAPTKLTFVKAGDGLISEGVLPAGNDFPAVVQIKATADAKTVVEKFNVDLSICGECKKAEYACTCAH